MQNSITGRWLTAALAIVTAGLMIILVTTPSADASHEPAQKVAAAGSDVDEVDDSTPILSETVRVSSTQDLVLQLTAECSILTELTTGPSDQPGATDSAFAFGSVRMRIEIDGKAVAVASDESAASEDDADDDDDEIGEVTFCNRAYSRTVSDGEDDQDGLDEEHDFIRTRTSNAFNWLALDVGFNYDDKCTVAGTPGCTSVVPANGNNIVSIVVYADYDTNTTGDAVADAFVGSRTLIAEPTNASVHEVVSR